MRAYLALCRKSFQEMIAYRGQLLVRFLGMFLAIYLLYTFWKGLYANATEVQGISFSSMLTYAILSAITGGMLNFLGVLQVYLAYWISRKMRTGEIVTDLLKPTNFQLYLFAHSLGRLIFNLVFSVPIAVAAFLIFNLDAPSGLSQFLLFLVSLGLSFLLVFLIDFIVSMTAFWTTQTRGVGGFTRLIISLLSGSFIPLWLFPGWARGVLAYLPFASIYHAPLSIYIGKLQGKEATGTILLQVLWIGALFAGSRLLWMRARRNLMMNGG